MKKASAYRLIDGTFSPEDATHILMELINNKINYHNLRVFSRKVRFNEDASHSEKRIGELEEMAKALRKTLVSADKGNQLVEIDCTINLTIKEKGKGAGVKRKSTQAGMPL